MVYKHTDSSGNITYTSDIVPKFKYNTSQEISVSAQYASGSVTVAAGEVWAITALSGYSPIVGYAAIYSGTTLVPATVICCVPPYSTPVILLIPEGVTALYAAVDNSVTVSGSTPICVLSKIDTTPVVT
jgi:hypothetical protein